MSSRFHVPHTRPSAFDDHWRGMVRESLFFMRRGSVGVSSPPLLAHAMAICVRLAAPSLRMICRTWTLTVPSWMPSCRAMTLLDSPLPSRLSTPFSLLVKQLFQPASRGGGRGYPRGSTLALPWRHRALLPPGCGEAGALP